MQSLAGGVVSHVKSALFVGALAIAMAGALGGAPTPVATVAPTVLPGDRPTEIFPVDKITPGLKGYGFSDLGGGKGIQRFDVEMIGTL
jgi:hypothetical protein